LSRLFYFHRTYIVPFWFIKAFHDGIQAINEVTRDAYLLALYHGTRRKEAYSLLWSQVDFEKETITNEVAA